MKRVSPSMAVALLALFVALGGTGYAAAKINGRNIKDRRKLTDRINPDSEVYVFQALSGG